MSRQITIAGGGLAGLGLGIGLLKQGLPVRLLEAGSYPRHRVCGEFICGVDDSTLRNLGITDAFEAKVINHDSQWFYGSDPVLKKKLPRPAIGISRHHLDHWLAEKFTEMGGSLETDTRASQSELPDEATAWTCGRKRVRDGRWIGLKCHVRQFGETMDTDLEMHFGKRCYVGISKVENATANVCGLFEMDRSLKADDRSGLLLKYLRSSGLETLADRLDSAEMLADSLLGVSAFALGQQTSPASETSLQLGDSFAMIPPFTGNGMTMALQSAEIALGPLADYARGEKDWASAVRQIRQAHHKRFNRRVCWAMRLHPFLLQPLGQRALVAMAKMNAVPFGLFFNKTR